MGAAGSRTRRAAAALLVALAGALILAAGAARAGEADASADDLAARRGEIEAEMERLRGALSRVEGQVSSLLGRVERLRVEAKLREREVAAAELERRRLERAIDRLRFEEERLAERLKRRREVLALRLRALYRRGPLVPARALSLGAGSAEWLRALGLLEHLSRQEASAIEGLRSDAANLERNLAEQRAALVRQQEQRRETEISRASLAEALRRQQRMLEAVRGDRDTHRAAYEELSHAARELDAMIETLRRGEAPHAPEGAWVSLGPFRGLLDWPVEGALQVPFGDVRHPRFGTLTPHRGLTFAASQGAAVRAVFEGEVVFRDWLRGYGEVVILDHHHGYMTVYAHLSSPEVQVGQRLSRGGAVGRAGDSGSLEGPQLYFELRRDGVTLDPEPWLSGRGIGTLRGER
jgi:septal ring factor EnvC (AmiA/AmiB activator)